MATPARRSDVPAAPSGPVPVLAPAGWLLTLAGGLGLILGSWMLYPLDYDGMWAGYRDGILGTVALVATMALNTSLPKRPAIGLLGLCGVLAVLFAVFISDEQVVFIMELICGIVLLVGTAFQAAAERR